MTHGNGACRIRVLSSHLRILGGIGDVAQGPGPYHLPHNASRDGNRDELARLYENEMAPDARRESAGVFAGVSIDFADAGKPTPASSTRNSAAEGSG